MNVTHDRNNAAATAAAEAGVRIVLRPLASGLPIGFFAFGIGAFLLSGLDLHWIAEAQGREVALIALGFVAPLELLAALLAFAARDVGAATALGLFGACWVAVALVLLGSPPGGTSPALGMFQCALALPLVFLAAGAATGKPVLAGVLALGAARFALAGVYELTADSWANTAGGWVGLPLCALAAYLGFALLLEDARGRTVLPLLRRADARAALEATFDRQIAHLHHEAGVRDQL